MSEVVTLCSRRCPHRARVFDRRSEFIVHTRISIFTVLVFMSEEECPQGVPLLKHKIQYVHFQKRNHHKTIAKH
jgi:hypothetical protein